MRGLANWSDNYDRLRIAVDEANVVRVELSGKFVHMSWTTYIQFVKDINASLAMVAREQREAEAAPQVA